LQADKTGLLQQVESLQTQVSSAESSLSAAEETHHAELTTLQDERTVLQKQVDELQAQVSSAKAAADTAEQALQAELAILQADKTGLLQQVESLQTQVSSAESSLSAAEETHHAELTTLQDERTVLQQHVDELQAQVSSAESSIFAAEHAHQAEIETMQAERSEMMQQCETFRGQVNMSERVLSEIKKQHATTVSSLQAENSDLREQVEVMRGEVEALENVKASADDEHAAEVSQMQANLDEMGDALQTSEVQAEELAGQVARLEVALESEGKRREEAEAREAAASAESSATQEALEAQVSELEAQVAESIEQADRLREELGFVRQHTRTEEPHARRLDAALDEAACFAPGSRLQRGRQVKSLQQGAASPATLLLAGKDASHSELPPLSGNDWMDSDARTQELTLTMERLKADCELLEAENCSMKEVMVAFEGDLDQHAQSIGHVNHKQKIRYTLKLKDEINRLLEELRKARQRIIQLEANQTNEHLLEALASLGLPFASSCRQASHRGVLSSARDARPARRRCTMGGPGVRPTLLDAMTPSPVKGRQASTPTVMITELTDAKAAQLEAERCCELQRRALERITMDFRHLRALIERVVMVAGVETHTGAGAVTFPELLGRLRAVIATARRDGWQGVPPACELGGA